MNAMSQQRISQTCLGSQPPDLPAGGSESAQSKAEYEARLAAAADKAEKVTAQHCSVQVKVHCAGAVELSVHAECCKMLSSCTSIHKFNKLGI